MKCPECQRPMQELFTRSSQTKQYARVGYLCPFDDVVIIDDWTEEGDYRAKLFPSPFPKE